MAKIAKDVMKMIADNDIKMVDFKMVDINGQFRHVTIPALSMTGNAMIIDYPNNRPLAQYPRNIVLAAEEYMKKTGIADEMLILPEFEKAGIPVKYHHPEVGAADQFEIEPKLGKMSKMADGTMNIKYIIRNVAVKYGKNATCNPYFAYAAILMAGLDGIKNKIDPHKNGWGPYDVNLYTLSDKEKKKLKQLPTRLDDALDALEKDNAFLTEGGVFPVL